jgi:hypothetical protein
MTNASVGRKPFITISKIFRGRTASHKVKVMLRWCFGGVNSVAKPGWTEQKTIVCDREGFAGIQGDIIWTNSERHELRSISARFEE